MPRYHLTDAERGILAAIFASHPSASNGQVRLIFGRRAGRAICDESVRRARMHGYKASPKARRLTSAHRATLTGLCLDAAPDYCRSEIARQFEAATGRPLSAWSVTRFLVRLGLPVLAKGDNARCGLRTPGTGRRRPG